MLCERKDPIVCDVFCSYQFYQMFASHKQQNRDFIQFLGDSYYLLVVHIKVEDDSFTGW